MGWPTIADSALLKNINSDPSLIKVAKTTDISDGADKLVRGPWWCRDCVMEYTTDFVWNPLNQNFHVDMSAIDLTWGYMPTGGGYGPEPGIYPSYSTWAEVAPGGQPTLLQPYWDGGTMWGWNYRYNFPGPAKTGSFQITVSKSLGGGGFPAFYSLSCGFWINANPPKYVFSNQCNWMGIKSGADPRGEYVLSCSNSLRPAGGPELRGQGYIALIGDGMPPTPQLYPTGNTTYTPAMFSITVTD